MVAQITCYAAFKLSEQVIQTLGKEMIIFEKISFNSWVKLKSFIAKASVQTKYWSQSPAIIIDKHQLFCELPDFLIYTGTPGNFFQNQSPQAEINFINVFIM